MKKSWSTRSHFTHARSCSRALNQVPTRAKQPASNRTYSLWKGDISPFNRFTGYKKSNQNQFGRVLPFAFALTCYKISLFFSSLHREHTILLSRERENSVNKGTKRMNSSPVVISYLTRFYWENRCLQILSNNVALNSYLGLSALSIKNFWFV